MPCGAPEQEQCLDDQLAQVEFAAVKEPRDRTVDPKPSGASSDTPADPSACTGGEPVSGSGTGGVSDQEDCRCDALNVLRHAFFSSAVCETATWRSTASMPSPVDGKWEGKRLEGNLRPNAPARLLRGQGGAPKTLCRGKEGR